MTRFYATITMEQYFIMARSYVIRHSNETSPAELLRCNFSLTFKKLTKGNVIYLFICFIYFFFWRERGRID